MARLDKERRKYLGGSFNIEDYIRSISGKSKDTNDTTTDKRMRRNLTLADIPKVDASNRTVKTFIKSKNDDD